MKTIDKIKKELLDVNFALNTIHKKDKRVPIWEGYRSALLFVLNLEDEKIVNKSIELLR